MAKAKYYVLARSLWEGDTWKAIAGSFDSLEEAQKVADEEAHDGWSDSVWSEKHQAYYAPIQDLKSVVNTIVVNTTTMRREYGISKEQERESIHYRELDAEWEREMMKEEEDKGYND